MGGSVQWGGRGGSTPVQGLKQLVTQSQSCTAAWKPGRGSQPHLRTWGAGGSGRTSGHKGSAPGNTSGLRVWAPTTLQVVLPHYSAYSFLGGLEPGSRRGSRPQRGGRLSCWAREPGLWPSLCSGLEGKVPLGLGSETALTSWGGAGQQEAGQGWGDGSQDAEHPFPAAWGGAGQGEWGSLEGGGTEGGRGKGK